MQIHLQKIPREEKALNIYGFVREGGWLLGILLGKICVQGSGGEARLQMPSGNIGGSGYVLSQLAGMWVESGQGRNYLTVFDDEEIDTAKLVKELPETVQKETEEEEWTEEKEPEAAGVHKEGAAETKIPEEAEETEKKEPEAAGVHKEETAEEDSREEPGGTAEEDGRSGSGMERSENPEAAGAQTDSEKEGTAGRAEEKGSEQLHAQETAACPVPGCSYRNRQAHSAGLDQKWKMLSDRCPHFMPFADDELTDCIQITPRELHVIGQGNCRIGNNSFLMHGFCNYRHLLFGRLRNGGYLLGIPGIFENQELFMANMFGFPEFKEAASRYSQGRFGYWCRRL